MDMHLFFGNPRLGLANALQPEELAGVFGALTHVVGQLPFHEKVIDTVLLRGRGGNSVRSGQAQLVKRPPRAFTVRAAQRFGAEVNAPYFDPRGILAERLIAAFATRGLAALQHAAGRLGHFLGQVISHPVNGDHRNAAGVSIGHGVPSLQRRNRL